MKAKKQEWSEENEKNLSDAILFIKTGTYSLDKEKLINWLKSLRPQNRWKPNDEQLDALHDAAVYVDKSMFTYPKGILMKLYKQLKKLK